MYGSKDANPGEHQLGRHSFMIGMFCWDGCTPEPSASIAPRSLPLEKMFPAAWPVFASSYQGLEIVHK